MRSAISMPRSATSQAGVTASTGGGRIRIPAAEAMACVIDFVVPGTRGSNR